MFVYNYSNDLLLPLFISVVAYTFDRGYGWIRNQTYGRPGCQGQDYYSTFGHLLTSTEITHPALADYYSDIRGPASRAQSHSLRSYGITSR